MNLSIYFLLLIYILMDKYLKYKNKYNELRQMMEGLMTGMNDAHLNKFNSTLNESASSDEDSDNKQNKALNKIIKLLNKKGYSFWFDVNGEVWGRGESEKKAKQRVIKKVKGNEEYRGKLFMDVVIRINKDDNQVAVSLYKYIVTMIGKHFSIAPTGGKDDIMTYLYNKDEFKHFSLEKFREVAKKFIKNEQKINPFKKHSYSEFKKILNI